MSTDAPHTTDARVLATRRHFLAESATGLGAAALAWLLHKEALAAAPTTERHPHLAPRATRVLHIFSPGGVSQVDTFDYKPELEKHDGQELTGKGKLDTFFGKPGRLMKSVFPFRQRGQCGKWVSDLFPHLGGCVDELVFLHSLTTKSSSHTPACFQMNTGFTQNGFPSVGSWLSYGLGSLNDNLPTFVVLPDPRGLPNGGDNNWSNGFLPADYQATAFRTERPDPVPFLATPAGIRPGARQAASRLLADLNRRHAETHPGDDALAARLQGYELAARMQTSIPAALDFADETVETKRLYGLDQPLTAPFARNCLLARRLLESGVRFVQLYNGGALGSPRINWDAHEDVKDNHARQGTLLDRPVAGLLRDLRRRGLLDDTLVYWSSEFGRTPFTQGLGARGRDHHPLAFTCWLAGAGLKKGTTFGQSDELGYQPASDPVTVYDLHATVLHLLGLDHTRLSFYHNGIQRRLTDVHGHVIERILT